MKKIAYLLSVYLFCLLPKLQAQDIDFPLSLSEIEKYESRIRIQRLPAVTITHADAYKIRTRQPVYSPRIKEIVLDIINMDGPTAELEYHNLKQMVNGKWQMARFPLYRQSCIRHWRKRFIQRRYATRTYPYVRV